jgi:hypothetical protein
MAFNQAMMDDLVVIPTITLNPKKAKKKLKKAARMSDDMEVTQLPVYQEAKEEINPAGFSQSPPKAASKSSPKNKAQVRHVPAPKPVQEPAFFKPAPAVQAKPAPNPQTCAAQALATSNICKRSWYDITEEDEDDFIGLSFANSSAPQMIA